MATNAFAAGAYAAIQGLAPGQAKKPAGAAPPTGGGEFSSLVKEAIGGVVDAGRKSDAQAKAMASGKANMVDVVTAVTETEVAIETLVSVRDKVIKAYEEIMKMPI